MPTSENGNETQPVDSILDRSLTRREFLQTSAAASGAVALESTHFNPQPEITELEECERLAKEIEETWGFKPNASETVIPPDTYLALLQTMKSALMVFPPGLASMLLATKTVEGHDINFGDNSKAINIESGIPIDIRNFVTQKNAGVADNNKGVLLNSKVVQEYIHPIPIQNLTRGQIESNRLTYERLIWHEIGHFFYQACGVPQMDPLEDYVGENWKSSDSVDASKAYHAGFETNYSRSTKHEDFAENIEDMLDTKSLLYIQGNESSDQKDVLELKQKMVKKICDIVTHGLMDEKYWEDLKARGGELDFKYWDNKKSIPNRWWSKTPDNEVGIFINQLPGFDDGKKHPFLFASVEYPQETAEWYQITANSANLANLYPSQFKYGEKIYDMATLVDISNTGEKIANLVMGFVTEQGEKRYRALPVILRKGYITEFNIETEDESALFRAFYVDESKGIVKVERTDSGKIPAQGVLIPPFVNKESNQKQEQPAPTQNEYTKVSRRAFIKLAATLAAVTATAVVAPKLQQSEQPIDPKQLRNRTLGKYNQSTGVVFTKV